MSHHRAIILARASSEKQSKGASIDDQLAHMRQYCEKKGIEIVAEFSEIVSGTKTGRKTLDAAFAMCKKARTTKRPIQYVFFHEWTRAARNIAEQAAQITRFRAIGVELNVANDATALNKKDPGSVVMTAVNWGIAEAQSVQISNHTKSRIEFWRNQGYFLSRPPHGFYRSHKDTAGRWIIAPIPELAGAYKSAFIALAQGEPLLSVYKRLGGRQTFQAKQTYLDAMRNPVYAGYIQGSNGLIKGKFDGVVSLEVFQLAQETISSNRSTPKSKESDTLFPAKGVMKCAKCGASMGSEIPVKKLASGEKKPFYYYRCVSNQKHGRLKREEVSNAIADFFGRLVISPELKAAALKKLADKQAEDKRRFTAQLTGLEKRLQEATEMVKNAQLMLVRKEIDTETYATVKAEKASIENQITATRSALGKMDAIREVFTQVIQHLPTMYQEADPAGMAMLLRTVFPQGFTIENGKLRTEKVNFLLSYLLENERVLPIVETDRTQLNPETGERVLGRTKIEPVSLKDMQEDMQRMTLLFVHFQKIA